MKKNTKKNLYKMAIGLCALSTIYCLCITPFVSRTNTKAKLAGAAGAFLGTVGLGLTHDSILKHKKERN